MKYFGNIFVENFSLHPSTIAFSNASLVGYGSYFFSGTLWYGNMVIGGMIELDAENESITVRLLSANELSTS